ncbi:uncharacterized protein GJ701_005781 isoform 1-T1 [Geothlypis trichas]
MEMMAEASADGSSAEHLMKTKSSHLWYIHEKTTTNTSSTEEFYCPSQRTKSSKQETSHMGGYHVLEHEIPLFSAIIPKNLHHTEHICKVEMLKRSFSCELGHSQLCRTGQARLHLIQQKILHQKN